MSDDKRERLRQIFIDEASEIVEKLDIDIINFEEDPGNRDLLHELFRGVHTLKGSANSIGFLRLGTFVHSFEDLLDYYRSDDAPEPDQQTIDLLLEAVDVIRQVFDDEVAQAEVLSDQVRYDDALQHIRARLAGDAPAAAAPPEQDEPLNDLAAEFGNDAPRSDTTESTPTSVKTPDYQAQLEDGERLYAIRLTFDSDIYFRGYDHCTFLRMLAEQGRLLGSHWDLSAIPSLQELDPQTCFIGAVDVFLASRESMEQIEEIFEFLDDFEYQVREVEHTTGSPEDADSVSARIPPDMESSETPGGDAQQGQDTTPGTGAPEVAVLSRSMQQSDSRADQARNDIEKQQKANAKDAPRRKEEKRSYVRIDTRKLDELFDSVGELVIAQNFLYENQEIRALDNENVAKTIETLSKITRLIQNRVMGLRMVAIRDTFEKMKRVVRDSARKVDKDVHLQISGEETEIDKTMVDALSDPLIHLLRNAVDHGLETPDSRREAGKAGTGNVWLRAFHKGGSIVIQIEDDGAGINRQKVLTKALERGVVTEEEAGTMTDTQIDQLIMQAGFSTADQISDLSGRGVGLDVVRSSIEQLRGKIEIDSEPGKGSTFTIVLPLTLAIIDGMLVRAANETFIIPTLSILESFRPSEGILHTYRGRGEFVNLREELLPIVRLNRVLELSHETPSATESTLVCVENERGRFAILVDELVGRQQVVIKSLGALNRFQEISGGAVMGNGEIALILNVEGIH